MGHMQVEHADEDWNHLDWSKAPAIQEMPITSSIIRPRQDAPIAKGAKTAKVEGYAVAGGGREVIRVDVSGDGGQTWQPATLSQEGADQGYRRHWAWRHFEVQCCLLTPCNCAVVVLLIARCKACCLGSAVSAFGCAAESSMSLGVI